MTKPARPFGAALIAKRATRERLEQGLALAISEERTAAEELRRYVAARETAQTDAEAAWCTDGSPAQLLAARAGAAAELDDCRTAVERAEASLESARRALEVARRDHAAASAEEEAVKRVAERRAAKAEAVRRARAEEDGE